VVPDPYALEHNGVHSQPAIVLDHNRQAGKLVPALSFVSDLVHDVV
jgi:hypothetical protein